MSNIIEINDLPTLQNHRLLWQSLLPQTRGASFFHSLDWFEQYWKHYGPEGTGVCQKMRILVVHAAEKPIGILPLVVRHESKLAGPQSWRTVRTLDYPLHDWGSSYGPIGRNPAATLLAGLGHIARTERDWDVIELASIDQETVDHGRTPRALAQVGLQATVQDHEQSARVVLDGGWEDYWASRTSKHRNNVRRIEKKLAEQGEVEYVRYRPAGTAYGDDDPRWDLFETCLRVSRSSWQSESTDGTTLSHESILPFLRDVHTTAVNRGALDINLLYLGSKAVAYSYNYIYNGYIFGLRMGFDASATTQGAGTALVHRSIQDSFERGDQIYDLGTGYLESKRRWWNALVTTKRYTHYPALELKAQTLRWGRRLQGWVQQARAARGGPKGSAGSKKQGTKAKSA